MGIWEVDNVTGWVFYLKSFSYGLGIILLALSILGVLKRIYSVAYKRDRMSLLLLSFPVTYYLMMGSTRHYFARYALPLVPFLLLFSAEAILIIVGWVETRLNKRGWVYLSIAIIGVVVQPLAASIRFDTILTRQDTRTLAKQWIETFIPAGEKIALEWPIHSPYLSTMEKTEPYSEKVYNVTTVSGMGLFEHPVDWYYAQGFDYLISTSFIFNIPLIDKEKEEERRKFYTSIDQEYKLIKEFKPSNGDIVEPFIFDDIYGPTISLWKRDRPGPTLKLYKITK
jgi:hypothetical protein